MLAFLPQATSMIYQTYRQACEELGNVDIDDGEALFDSPFDIVLGKISLVSVSISPYIPSNECVQVWPVRV